MSCTDRERAKETRAAAEAAIEAVQLAARAELERALKLKREDGASLATSSLQCKISLVCSLTFTKILFLIFSHLKLGNSSGGTARAGVR